MGLLDPIGCMMWSLTPYDKCDYRCVYCCTRVQGTSKPSVAPGDMLRLVCEGLDRIPEDELVIIGAFCDGYPLVEAELGLTRPLVAELIERDRRFAIVTKGTTVLRDLDLLRRARPGKLQVTISLSTTDEGALAKLEPAAPSGKERLAVVRSLSDAGLFVDVNALPWIPDVSDTQAIIDAVPPGVPIVFAPLATGVDRDHLTLLGRRYLRHEIWERYLAEYERFGHVPNTSWVQPRLPPTENDPMYRLPRREPPIPAPHPQGWRAQIGRWLGGVPA